MFKMFKILAVFLMLGSACFASNICSNYPDAVPADKYDSLLKAALQHCPSKQNFGTGDIQALKSKTTRHDKLYCIDLSKIFHGGKASYHSEWSVSGQVSACSSAYAAVNQR